MKQQIRKTLNWIHLQKEGAVVGMLIASLLFIINIYKPMDIINRIMRYLPQNPWWYQLATVLFIGMSIGALADSIILPRR